MLFAWFLLYMYVTVRGVTIIWSACDCTINLHNIGVIVTLKSAVNYQLPVMQGEKNQQFLRLL